MKRLWDWGKLLALCFIPAILYKALAYVGRYRVFIEAERQSSIKLPWGKRLWAWRNGFLSRNIVLYDLNGKNARCYMPDFAYRFAHPYNRAFAGLVQNKLNVYFTLRAFHDFLPVHYFLLYRSEMLPLDGSGSVISQGASDVILDLCREKGKLVLKPFASGRGIGFHVMTFADGGFRLDGLPISELELRGVCDGLEDYIITEFVKQHRYADAWHPETTNTLRILTIRDYEAHEAFIARALQRIGRKSTIPVDNWSQGGLGCSVNVETGVIGPGVPCPKDTRIVRYDCHPDTKTPITGTQIPHWPLVTHKILEMSNHLGMVPYLGWDVVVTEDGFRVLEINHLSDLDLLQIHSPLLDDERVRRFYAAYTPGLPARWKY